MKQMKTRYYIREKGNHIRPEIYGGMSGPTIFNVFLGLLNFDGAKTIEEARQCKEWAENKHHTEFEIIKIAK